MDKLEFIGPPVEPGFQRERSRLSAESMNAITRTGIIKSASLTKIFFKILNNSSGFNSNHRNSLQKQQWMKFKNWKSSTK